MSRAIPFLVVAAAVPARAEPDVTATSEQIEISEPRPHDEPGDASLTRDEIAHVPGTRNDAVDSVRSMPGVGNVPSIGYGTGLVIRGTSPAESKIFVDGFAIPILYHLGGLSSVIPTEMIDGLLYKPGAFGVDHGGATGGLVEVASRRGADQLRGFADVSFIAAQGLVQGPIGRHGNFAVAVRRSYIDGVLALAVPNTSSLSFTTLPRYYDFQARVDYDLGARWQLTGLLLGSDDKLALVTDAENPEDPMMTGTFAQAARFVRGIWSATYRTKRFATKLAASSLLQDSSFSIGADRYLRDQETAGGLRDETWIGVTDRVAIVAGAEGEVRCVDAQLRIPRPPREGDPAAPNFTYGPIVDEALHPTLVDAAAWTALQAQPADRVTTTAGIRVDVFARNRAVVPEPRAQARLTVAEGTAVLAAGGLYSRAPENQDEALQASLAPERAWQGSLGLERTVAPGVTLQATGYYAAKSDLIVPALDPSHGYYDNSGAGRSYGGELLVRARTRRFFGWAAYTLGHSERRDHPGEPWRLFDDDQTHNLVVLGSLKVGARWQLGARFQYTSGLPYTPVMGAVFSSDSNTYTPMYGPVNSQRASAQHQVDLRVDHIWTFASWKLSAYLDVANVYMNAAAVEYTYNRDYTKRDAIRTIPILPSIGLRGEL
jgi:hypothetical protein